MKHCPQCGRVFSDDALRFCLYDGQPLAAGGEAPPSATPLPPAHTPGGAVRQGKTGQKIALVGLALFAGLALLRGGRHSPAPTPKPVSGPAPASDPVPVSGPVPASDPVPAASPDAGAVLTETLRRADDAESQAFRTVDAAPLDGHYQGAALQHEKDTLQTLRQTGTYVDSRLLSFRLGTFTVSPDGSEAKVEVEETWNLTVYSSRTRQPLQKSTTRVLPQQVHLVQTSSGWVVDQIQEGASSPTEPPR